jgi:hypothetical protein
MDQSVSPMAVQRRGPARTWRGLLLSLGLHALLVVAACWIVFREPMAEAKREFTSHVVAGGKSGGPTQTHPIARKPKANLPPMRLTSKSASATLVLPPMKAMTSDMGLAGLSGGQGKGGFGRGMGSFGSDGPGAGLGNRSGFTGRPVMGAFIRAKRVAVYLDCSGSMRSYLPRVEAEIRKEFPDADVFRFDGARVVGLGDMVVFGRRFRGDAPRLREGPTQTALETLTPNGRAVQAKVRTACEKGSLGAWMDRLLAESYDALVVFSDFQDGVRLYESKKGEPKMVYSDSSYRKVGGVQKGHTRWQREWLETFAKAPHGAGPRLYLFTVQQEPQAFLLACVAASGGASTSVSWLKKSGRKTSP